MRCLLSPLPLTIAPASSPIFLSFILTYLLTSFHFGGHTVLCSPGIMVEGIALLSSVYGDLDSDIDDDDHNNFQPHHQTTSPPPDAPPPSSSSIVDYAHDDLAPGDSDLQNKEDKVSGAREEADDSMQIDEGDASVQVAVSPGVQSHGSQPSGHRSEEDLQTEIDLQEVAANGEGVPSAGEDLFADFWPSPPATPCSDELQAKFVKFLKYKEQGINFNENLRHSKGYRNPDFLQHAVMHQQIDETGSCFNPKVFDPHGYDRSDYADALASEQRKEAGRREQERRQNQRTSVDFVRAQLLTSQKVSLAAAAATSARLAEGGHPHSHTIISSTSSVVHTTTTTSEVRNETRTNKKSKWDKAGHH